MSCCTLNALRGDQMITIDFTGSDATLRQAAMLVDSAFKRIDKPLKIDGASNVASARLFNRTRPKPLNPCTVLSQAEAEAVLGALVSAPTPGGTISCKYEIPRQKNGIPQIYELEYDWEGGYDKYRSDEQVNRILGLAMGGAANAAADAPSAAGSDPWERAGVVGHEFEALKKDVRIKIDQRMLDADKARALVAAAMRKIE